MEDERPEGARIKGTSIALTLDLVRERRGDKGIEDLAGRLPASVRAELEPDYRPLATQLFSFDVWAEVLLAAESLFGSPVSIVRESGRRGYLRLLQTTYRNWVLDGNPTETLRRIPLLWQQVTSGLGQMVVEERADGPVVVVKLEVPARYRAITEERIAGVAEALVEAAGGVPIVSIVHRDDKVEFHVKVT